MIIGVTGATGRLGSALVEAGCKPMYADVTSPTELQREMGKLRPDTIIHCAAITAVDDIEDKLYEEANRVNVLGTACLRNVFGGQIIYISTDYVFDGQRGPYKETSLLNPISAYGMTKYLGEEIIKNFQHPEDVIVRTTILYGTKHRWDFVRAILSKLNGDEPFRVTTEISGTPTYVGHLAEALIALTKLKSHPRIINIAGKEVLSRYEFALMIANVFGFNPELVLPTKNTSGKASRPRKAGLKVNLAEKLGLPIYSVHEGLEAMMLERGWW